MKDEDRKAALAAYKERKIEAGIYAVRCSASGQAWVGSARDLSTIQNRIWFSLRHGGSPQRALQHGWNQHGAEAFAFEIVERLEEADTGLGRDRILKTLLEKWVDALRAERI